MDKRERTGGGRWWIMGNGHASWKSKYGREREREGERDREECRKQKRSDPIRSDQLSSINCNNSYKMHSAGSGRKHQ